MSGADLSITAERVEAILKTMRMGEIPRGVVTVEEDAIVRRRWAMLPGSYSWMGALLSFRDPAGFERDRRRFAPVLRERMEEERAELARIYQTEGESGLETWKAYNPRDTLDELDAVLAETLPAAAYRQGIKQWQRLVGAWSAVRA